MSNTIDNLQELGINIQEIYKALFQDQTLCKLVYYTDDDPLSHADIATPETTLKNYIKFKPMIGSNETTEVRVIFVINGGKKIDSNKRYQAVSMAINVYTPLENWFIKNANFRPMAILSRLIALLDNKTVSGLGKLECGDFDLTLVTEEVACYTVQVDVILSA